MIFRTLSQERHTRMIHWARGFSMAMGLSGLLLQASGLAAPSAPPNSWLIDTQIEGPIAGVPSLGLGKYSLANLGYAESEYFFSGRATAFESRSKPHSDGRWPIKTSSKASFESRFVVVAPIDPSKFSGTVIVEWLNESGGFDAAIEWGYGHDEIVRSGDIYVGVSAQPLGVEQLKSVDPSRYSALHHPGISYSYDIFSQAGEVFRKQATKIIPGFQPPKVLIAAGESQSATYMTTYVDAIAPIAKAFDSYLIHSRGKYASPLSLIPYDAAPRNLQIRTDLHVPVLTFLTETDVLGPLDAYPALQPDSKYFRVWEVAGTAHADTYLTDLGPNDDGNIASDQAEFAAITSPPTTVTPEPGLTISCPVGFNAGEHHYVLQTAFRALASWTETGVAPTSMPRFEVTSGWRPSYALDSNGNVMGGIRTPAVDAPQAILSGLPGSTTGGDSGTSSRTCILIGHTVPFTQDQLIALYPTHGDFVNQWQQSVSKDLAAGYLLPEDADRLNSVVQ